MKIEQETKDFDAVNFMRQVRDKISADICDLSTEQILEYFKNHVPKERIIPLSDTKQ
ncbi:MAG: hypothetical protein LBT50_00070 [Prevotellaceae bacterium]|jgi:hypothetical protein|nr:hypothetical protein [Prevotellaceae bacterium]